MSKDASIAPVATQLAGQRELYILSASWRVDSALSDTLPWLPSHLSGGFWAGRACFLSAALVADATSLNSVPQSLSELAAVPSPGALLAQHYLCTSTGKLSRKDCSQAKTSSFGYTAKELMEGKCL